MWVLDVGAFAVFTAAAIVWNAQAIIAGSTEVARPPHRHSRLTRGPAQFYSTIFFLFNFGSPDPVGRIVAITFLTILSFLFETEELVVDGTARTTNFVIPAATPLTPTQWSPSYPNLFSGYIRHSSRSENGGHPQADRRCVLDEVKHDVRSARFTID